jgi:hypothetical protein
MKIQRLGTNVNSWWDLLIYGKIKDYSKFFSSPNL